MTDGAVPLMTDGVVSLRAATAADVPLLIAGRDADFHRYIGEGSTAPQPSACVLVEGDVVGWVDYDSDREWLRSGGLNIGYNVFDPQRGCGYATRAVQLLVHHLAVRTSFITATALIDPTNTPSMAVAKRCGFEETGRVEDQLLFERSVPPLTYTDGTVTIRRLAGSDVGADVEAKDDEQMRWLWLPVQREKWDAMSGGEQHAHALTHLELLHDSFGLGPKWAFAVDSPSSDYVAYVDADLANDQVPAGEANISYSSHPRHRGLGFVSKAVRLLLQFLRENTGARVANIIVDEQNTPSVRVALAAGAAEVDRFTNEHGRAMIRYEIGITPGQGR